MTQNQTRDRACVGVCWSKICPKLLHTLMCFILFQYVQDKKVKKPQTRAPLSCCTTVLSSCLQLTKTTNRCHVSPRMQGECVLSRGLPWQWGLCAVPGASRCALVYCFPLIFIWPLGWRLFLPLFSSVISSEEIIFEPQHWDLLIQMTWHTHTQRAGVGFDGTCQSLSQSLLHAGNNASRSVFNKLNDKLC